MKTEKKKFHCVCLHLREVVAHSNTTIFRSRDNVIYNNIVSFIFFLQLIINSKILVILLGVLNILLYVEGVLVYIWFDLIYNVKKLYWFLVEEGLRIHLA